MLHIQFSNRYERLEAALLDALAAPRESPFTADEVIVPSAALRRRVELAAADRFGICANVRFSFFAQWLWRQIGHIVPVSEMSPFTARVLTWRVVGILSERAFTDAHPRLSGYLRGADEVMRYELAGRVATLLEHYLTYRSDWLADWLEGKSAYIPNLDDARREDERWQAALWQRIARDLGTGSRHPSAAFFEAMEALGPDAPMRAGLPSVAHVFCLPATPPLYLDILTRLARFIDLRLYVLNPCREYWFDIVAPGRLAWLAAEGRAGHHEVGNPLLAAWGGQTRAHLGLVLDADPGSTTDDADFVPAGGGTLLARVQDAILDLTDLPRGSVDLAPDDRSIEVHVCHSLTRELEVLQDQLLALFAGENPPRPSDILVVTPDLEAAAPLIDAVFGNAPHARAIPYTITGRPASARNSCAHALLSILGVATSRFPASAVFELLQQPVIARRFAIDAGDLAAIHAWIGVAGIRWGIDARHRGELRLPAVDDHSFADGLDRLFMGYALPDDASAPLDGRLPAGGAEGSGALALGSFRAFVRALERLHDDLARPKTPEDWRQALLGVVDGFIAPEGDELDDARETVAAIGALGDDIAQGGLREAIPIDVVRLALQAQLDDPARGGTPGGAVTFAAMASLRNLPYRFVCVLGMNDGAFPTAPRESEFDLMARAPRPGDRQRRTDERNLFLDLLLAARERLYLSCTGRSIRYNAPLPPSVLVSELLDHCALATDRAPHSRDSLAAARARLVVEHPLQAFSIDCYAADADPRRRSFNDEYCEALKARLAGPMTLAPTAQAATTGDEGRDGGGDEGSDDDEASAAEPQQPFFRAPLAEPGPEYRDVTLDALASFFRNPCRWLLRERLGIALPEGDEELDDDEPFVADARARQALAERVLPRLLADAPETEIHDFARAGIEYPPGRLGDLERDRELRQMAAFARRLAPALDAPVLDPVTATLEFALDGEAWRVRGGFGDLRAGGLVRSRYADAKAGDYLEGWIAHLWLNAMAPPGVTAQTIWHSRDGHYRLPPLDDARGPLTALLVLYREGLRRPIHFYPKAAWAYARSDGNIGKARAAWRRDDFNPYGEEGDAACALALRGVEDPLDEEFARCAETVFDPLLGVIEDSRLEARA